MAPPHLRGALNILFQLSVTIGILAAQLINYGTQHFYWGWRVSLGCAIVPAIILFIGSLTLPGAAQLPVGRLKPNIWCEPWMVRAEPLQAATKTWGS